MTKLYPLKFKPILKERVWGGEVWQISGLDEDLSVISNGIYRDNYINELVETYLGDLVGDDIYQSYGNIFPILAKILQVNDTLSLQVHPSDDIAAERHDSYGKSECWYILEAKPEAKIYLGFNKDITPQEFYDCCMNNRVEQIMNIIYPQKGDFIYIEPGTVHAAAGGITIAEIQQVSDITYRLYDWGREHKAETKREMHLEMAIDCINYNKINTRAPFYLKKGEYLKVMGNKKRLCDNTHFTVDFIDLTKSERLLSDLFGSFIIYYTLEGEAIIASNNDTVSIKRGECCVIPAGLGQYTLEKRGELCNVLEITGKALVDEED